MSHSINRCTIHGCEAAAHHKSHTLCGKHFRELYAKQCTAQDCDGAQIAKGLCPKHYAQVKTAAGLRKKYDYICQECGDPGIGLSPDQKSHRHCANVKASRHAAEARRAQYLTKCRSQSQELVLVQKPRPVHQVTIIPGSVMFYTNCKVCGKQFLSRYTYRTCGDECKRVHSGWGKRNAKHRRRARKRNAYVANVYRKDIFARDNYTCQLCGEPMEMTATAPQHKQAECCDTQCFKAPTIDHIIPLAQGGTHEPDNVQSAHFICNALKSDTFERVY